jgi:hypothetical protein
LKGEETPGRTIKDIRALLKALGSEMETNRRKSLGMCSQIRAPGMQLERARRGNTEGICNKAKNGPV